MSATVNDIVTRNPVARHAIWLMATLLMLSACANLKFNGTQGSPSLTLTFREWAIDKDREEIKAGASTFLLRNQSGRTHEFVVVRINSKSDLPKHTESTSEPLDEDQFSEEQIVAELEHLPPGAEVRYDVTLDPGEYLILCNVMEPTPDGGMVSHYGMGMRTTLKVVK